MGDIGARRERSEKTKEVQSLIYDYLQSAYISQSKNRNQMKNTKTTEKIDFWFLWKRKLSGAGIMRKK
jgi:hypothetical protein